MGGSKLKNSSSMQSIVRTAAKTQQKCLNLSGYSQRIPEELFNDPFVFCLEELDLRNNDLQCLPSEISCLKSLKTLLLSGNKLTVLPSGIKGLACLTRLDLSRNSLTSICGEINCLKSLEEVNLNGNKLKNVPIYLLSLPRLRKLFCIRNETLENVPRDVAAQGLQAMRDYLGIQVEKYEIFVEGKIEDRNNGTMCKSFLGEIEKEWTLDSDQYIRKTKDACIGPELDESYLPFMAASGHGSLQRTSSEICLTGTQTLLCDSGCAMESLDQALSIADSIFNESKLDETSTDRKEPVLDTNNKDNIDAQGIEILVKRFCIQKNMLFEEMAKLKANQSKRNLDLDIKYLDLTHHSDDRMHCNVPRCNGCGLRRKELPTSEYGTLSTCSRKYSLGDSFADDNDSCDGNDGSVHEYLQSDSEDEEDELNSSCGSSVIDGVDLWSSSQGRFLNASNELVITQCGVQLTIPEFNLSGHDHTDFAFEIVSDVSSPPLSHNSVLASPVIRASPHGAKFYSNQPAVIKVPLSVVMEDDYRLKCYTSDTEENDIEEWTEIGDFEVNGGFVFIKTTHFSLFCAAVSKEYPRVQKSLKASEGGSLHIGDLPGLVVDFSSQALQNDITATMTAVYDDPRYVPEVTDSEVIASPVVALGPSGQTFKNDVTVTLPLPNAQKVFEIASEPTLTIMQSQTDLDKKPRWTKLQVDYKISNSNSVYTVSFNVRHFTLFTSAWNCSVSAAKRLKSKAMSLMFDVTHLVYFQAMMNDCNSMNQFGLYIFCLKVGEPPVTDCYQYQIPVGKTKQRQIKTGEITLSLRSNLFKADDIVGELKDGLVKTEMFNGNSFDKQFNLRFHQKFNGGPFGKVFVSSKDQQENVTQVLDFNLEKSVDKWNSSGKQLDEWVSEPVKELAGLLNIEDRWKELGLSLGYTRSEVNRKFTDTDNPIGAIQCDFIARGGETRMFTEAMYKVSRMYKLIPYDQMMENRENKQIENLSDTNSSRFCHCPPTPEKSPLRIVKRKLNSSYSLRDQEQQYTEGRLDSIAKEIMNHWTHVGRMLGIENNKIKEINQNLKDENVREKAFQMLIAWREQYPDECCPRTLCDALRKCDLIRTAQICSEI